MGVENGRTDEVSGFRFGDVTRSRVLQVLTCLAVALPSVGCRGLKCVPEVRKATLECLSDHNILDDPLACEPDMLDETAMTVSVLCPRAVGRLAPMVPRSCGSPLVGDGEEGFFTDAVNKGDVVKGVIKEECLRREEE